MGISTVAVLTACLTFFMLIVDRYRQSYVDDLDSLTSITGANCSASLAFGIPEDALQLLSSLSERPSIVTAVIHDSEGHLFMSYSRTNPSHENSAFVNAAQTSADSHPDYLHVVHAIELNGAKIGTITLYDDSAPLRAFEKEALLILLVVVCVIFGITYLFTGILKEIISKPISNLADIAKNISTKQDYGIRAQKESSDEIGHLIDAFNSMLDHISQRNEELEKSEYRFRTFINQAVDAFFLYGVGGKIIDVNPQACESLGYARQELLSMSVSDIDAESDSPKHMENYWRPLLSGLPATIEAKLLCKDGEIFPVEMRIGLLDIGGEKLVMALARDISERLTAEQERYQLESQLHQAQKMESIGTLAGGIAHDFNNILTPIFGYLELAMLKTADPDLLSNLTEVKKAADRAREMVQQILRFSRRDSGNASPIEVGIIVKETLKLLKASIPSTIEIRQNIAPNCGSVLANPTQVHQVLMNLCTNAYQAMRETGGILGVSLSPLEISSRDYIKKINLNPGPYLRLEVSDTGPGIDPETQERIFEPYFTTKAKGEGTGMGLSVVHGVVKAVGGCITVYSEVGRGTTFHIYFPVMQDSVSHTEVLPEGPIPQGTERIMIIDDEAMVRKVEKGMLTGLGYDVTDFATPFDALEYFTSHPNMFDLVITDMTMPKMTGAKLARKIMAIRPDIPVILCTGFSDLISEESAKSLGIRKYVTKPFISQTFGRTVRNVLDGFGEDEQQST